MRYWVYLDHQVVGPYEAADLKKIRGFSADTMVCSVESREIRGKPAWQKASFVPEIVAALQTARTSSQGEALTDTERQRAAAQEIIASILTPSAEDIQRAKPPAPKDLTPQQATELIQEVIGSITAETDESADSTQKRKFKQESSKEDNNDKPKRGRRLAPWLGSVGAGVILGGLFLFATSKMGRIAPALSPQATAPSPEPTAPPPQATVSSPEPTAPPAQPTAPSPESTAPPAQPTAPLPQRRAPAAAKRIAVPQEPNMSVQALEWVKAYVVPGTSVTIGEKLEVRHFVPGSRSPWRVKKTGADRYRVSFLVNGKTMYVFLAWLKSEKLEPVSSAAKSLMAGKSPSKRPHRRVKQSFPKPEPEPTAQPAPQPPKQAEPAKEQTRTHRDTQIRAAILPARRVEQRHEFGPAPQRRKIQLNFRLIAIKI